MRAALHAEWTKMRTVPGPLWLLLGTVVLTVALGAAVTSAITCDAAGCGTDTTRLSLTGIDLGQALVAILAVLAVSGEYGTGMFRMSLVAVPRRATVLAAKAVTLTGAVVAAGTVAVAGSTLAARFILPANGFTAAHGHPAPSLADGPTLRAVVGSVLYLALIGLLSLGVATAVRDSATSIGVVLGLLYLFPILSGIIDNPHWQRLLEQLGPMSAGLAIQATTDLSALPIGPWPGLGVLAVWAAGALLLGGLLLHLRDG
jgi:ABC-2 type transport system permease protein